MVRFWKRTPDDPQAVRMTIGEHLEELRNCVARSLAAIVIACLLCIWPAKYLLGLLARPMVLALRQHGQPDSFLATGPAENIVVYFKVVLIFALVIAGPYVVYQIWSFVAAGLHSLEKRWVRRLVPVSVGLFVVGVVFMYVFVLILSLNFLIGFSAWLPLPQPTPNVFERAVLHSRDIGVPASQPGIGQAPVVPLLTADPPAPPVGALWVNVHDQKLKVRWPDATYAVQLQRDDRRAMVTTHFRIGEYLSFVLAMMIAFGVAFQMPLVVVFLGRTGIVPVATMRKYRRVVILLVVLIAGLLAPPDLLSHLLLSGPMILLFELGLLLAGRKPASTAAAGAP